MNTALLRISKALQQVTPAQGVVVSVSQDGGIVLATSSGRVLRPYQTGIEPGNRVIIRAADVVRMELSSGEYWVE